MLELLYEALESDYGIVIECSNRETVRQKLYAARRDARDERLEDLSICLSPSAPNDIWIVRKRR